MCDNADPGDTHGRRRGPIDTHHLPSRRAAACDERELGPRGLHRARGVRHRGRRRRRANAVRASRTRPPDPGARTTGCRALEARIPRGRQSRSRARPTSSSCRDTVTSVFDGRERLASAARWEIGVDQLPMISTAVIRHDLIERHREIAGRVFPSIHPDIYSGYTFAYLADRYVSVDVPMGIAGLSAASNGVATFLQDGETPVAREFDELNRAAGLRPHPTVPNLLLVPIHSDDSFQHARDLLFPDDADLALDRRRMVERYLATIPETEPSKRAEVRVAIRSRSLIAPPRRVVRCRAPFPPPSAPWRSTPRLGYLAGAHVVDASRFAVTDVRVPPASARTCSASVTTRFSTSRGRLNLETARCGPVALRHHARRQRPRTP